MTEPIKPDDIVKARKNTLPDEIIQALNTLLTKKFNGYNAIIMQNDVVDLAIKLILEARKEEITGPNSDLIRTQIFENQWLDVEPIFEKFGWKVEYDKPAYNESYEANWTFTKRTKR